MFCLPLRRAMILIGVLLLSAGVQTSTDAQGVRIGNFFQAGGGQGFRLGGPRMGMHFGGGQGASIGGQYYGMRFGNGQGARIGGTQYGLQFGGQQGTQIGRLQTLPNGNPGTYYYGDVRQPGFAARRNSPQPQYVGPTSQPTLARRNFRLAPERPATAAGLPAQPTLAIGPASSPASSAAATSGGQVDLNGMIRLSHPADAPGDLAYRLNGTDFTLAPGKSVYMASGQQWNLEFSAGEGFGDREATLSESGDFVFQNSVDEGWVLVRNQPIEETQVIAPKPATANPGTTAVPAPAINPPASPTPGGNAGSVLINEPPPSEVNAGKKSDTPEA